MDDSTDTAVVTTSFQLFRKVEAMADALKPEDYVPPPYPNPPQGIPVLGEATDNMKRLWTLFAQLHAEHGLGEKEVLIRAVHAAMGYEVAKHCNCFIARFGITTDWRVYGVRMS